MKNKEKASIELQDDYDSVLEYIRTEAKQVDIEEPWIYTEAYEIKVEKGFERIYDEIERIFTENPATDDIFAKLDLPPKEVKNIHNFIWNLY